MAVRDTYHHLLFEYASGALDEAHALLVAAHVSLSPNARRIVQEYESIGGGLLQECCTPVALQSGALDDVLRRIECLQAECEEIERRTPACREADMLPPCVHHYIDIEAASLCWEKAGTHVQFVSLHTTSCPATQAQLLRVQPGAALRKAYDVILVLDGALIEAGQIFTRGDILLQDVTASPKTKADKAQGCLCLVLDCGHQAEPPPQSLLQNLLSALTGHKKR